MNTTDSALANVTDILHRANELTIQGINGTRRQTPGGDCRRDAGLQIRSG